MPSNKEKRARYPKDWSLRSKFIRFVRAKGKCEWCGVENYSIRNGSKIVLTTAHVYDKRPEVAHLLNLAALCQRCHLSHDKYDNHPKGKKYKKKLIPDSDALVETNSLLSEADKEHKMARDGYLSYLKDCVSEFGSVKNIAAIIGRPVTTVHSAMNEKSGYIATRNMSHEIMRKLEAVK